MRVLASATIAALTIPLFGASAHAMNFDLHGQLQHRFVRLNDFALDAEGTSHEQVVRHSARARVGARMSFSRNFWLSSTIQLLDGQILGAESPVPNGDRGVAWRNVPFTKHLQLRESILQVPIGLGVARLGRMPIRWGMGLVIHDGAGVDDPFDEPHGGDIVNGAWVDLTPLLPFAQNRLAYALHVGLGGDVIEQDDLTSRTRGDLAWRVAGSMTWEEPWFHGGVYVMRRELERANLDRAEHTLVDFAGRFQTRVADRFDLVVEAEAAYLSGSSTSGVETGQGVRTLVEQLGAATRVTLGDQELDATYTVEVGYASGDANPEDDRDTAFRFDPARRVGMILFDEVLARVSARERQRAQAAGDSVRELRPTNGAVSNALYVAPRVGLEVCDGCLTLQAGGVIAFATQPLISMRPDGPEEAPTGPTARAGALGYEINAGATVALDLESVARFSLGTQYGLFVPGEALDNQALIGLVHKWRLLADVSW